MSMMNASMNMGSGGLMKDLTPFVSHINGTIDYARYVITPYTGSKLPEGIEFDATHVFFGMIHFSAPVSYDSDIVITVPESYKMCMAVYYDMPSISAGSNSMGAQRWTVNTRKTTLSNISPAFRGFLFPSFLCYK